MARKFRVERWRAWRESKLAQFAADPKHWHMSMKSWLVTDKGTKVLYAAHLRYQRAWIRHKHDSRQGGVPSALRRAYRAKQAKRR